MGADFMGIIRWLKEISIGSSERLPANSYMILTTEYGEENGAILVHSDETRNLILQSLVDQADIFHGGNISSWIGDQLCSSSAIVNSALQSRQLLQVVGTPEVVAGIKNGSLSVMRSSGEMTGTVINSQSKRIAGQMRFAPANVGKVVGPLVLWQVLNAVAGVAHLHRINTKLESLERGIERLIFRNQAKTYGQLAAAISTLEELSKQCYLTGTFSNDMVVRLAIAERDIRSALAEQRLLVQRFQENALHLVNSTGGKKGAFSCNQVLREESNEFLIDAKLLTGASRASVLVSEAWLRHDLEHNPRHVSVRLRELEKDMETIKDTISPLIVLKELHEHAQECVSEMNWFSRKIFNRSLVKEIDSRDIPEESNGEHCVEKEVFPTALIWKDNKNETKCLVIDAVIEDI